MDDESLVAGTLAGRQDCFGTLVERHQRSIHGLAHRWLGDHAAADEVVQATFVQAYTHLVDFRGEASFRSWLCGIALNQARSLQRARRRERAVPLDEVPESRLGVEDRHVEKLKIPQGLLTERQVLILKCLYDEERDVAEVAQLLKIDAQTVRSTHHKALLRLRAHFGEETP